jgi:PAS domain S-box-containing protein
MHGRIRVAGWSAVATLVVAIVLLVVSVFVFVLPTIERELIREQRARLRDLTNAVWSMISYFHERQIAGALSEEDAQMLAKEYVRHVRYGSENRDYFWITDKTPRFVMHPILPDLEGMDLSAYPTITGRPLGEIARIVEREGAGYLEYKWPAPEDSAKMIGKTAYARVFEPWGWVVGTGVFMDEVQRGFVRARNRVFGAGSVILMLTASVMVINIRQQRLTEHQRDAARIGLEETERKFQALFENATEAIFQSTSDGNLLTANPAFARIFGYDSPDDAVNRINDIAQQCYADPGVREEFKRRIERDGVIQYFEFEGKRLDGSHVHLMMNAHLVRDQKGMVRYYEGIIQDVTSLKNTQEELRRLNVELEERVAERTSALARAAEELQSVSSVVLRWDPQGYVLYMNEYGLRLFKYEAEELVGRNVIETIVPPRDRAGLDLHEMISNLLRHPDRYSQNENENVCKDGGRLWMTWTNKPVYDESGKLKEILTVGIDISARKRVEEELQEARSSLERALREQEAFIESISDLFYVFDNKWRLVRWNRRLENMTGYSAEELRGNSLTGFLVAEDVSTARAKLEDLQRQDEVRIEARVQGRSGERVPHEFRTRRVEGEDESARYYVGIGHDLTERLASQARLVETEKMRALSGLVAGFLHELNTPLGALLSSLSVVGRGIGRLSAFLRSDARTSDEASKVQRAILDGESTARDAADRIATVLKGLKSFVNLDQADEKRYDVQKEMENVLQLLDPASRGIQIVRDYGDVGTIRCYPGEMNQMFMHVFSNALGAMNREATLVLQTRRRDDWVQILVTDTGSGIPEDRLNHIFEPQFTRKTSRVGLGLGLLTCYHVVNKHGGRIQVDSRVGVGTSVSIELPREGKFESGA